MYTYRNTLVELLAYSDDLILEIESRNKSLCLVDRKNHWPNIGYALMGTRENMWSYRDSITQEYASPLGQYDFDRVKQFLGIILTGNNGTANKIEARIQIRNKYFFGIFS